MLKRVYLFLVLLLFLSSLFLGIDHLFHRETILFSPHKIKTSNLFIPSSTPSLSLEKKEEIKAILNQKFLFYHSGKTSYSFISEDGHYLLKFAQSQRIKRKSWLAYFPFSFNPYYQEFVARQEEANKLISAWQLAYERLPEETGLVYVHSCKKEKLKKKVSIFDKNLEPYTIDLDKTVFCVQKHADLFYVRLKEMLQEHDLEKAKTCIQSVFSLISRLCCAGVLGSESTRSMDLGLIGTQVMQVEIDKLCTNTMCISKKYCRETIISMTEKFKAWLDGQSPELALYFDECLQSSWGPFPCDPL